MAGFSRGFDPGAVVTMFALAAVMGAGALGAAMILSWMEGRWGWSPGKRLMGIRVLGVDLKPCGFGRALLRTLMILADGQFFWVVAMLVAAITQNRQRVGDVIARTVVVRVR
jgi:uncharacterized RDD family membrane protein YckC